MDISRSGVLAFVTKSGESDALHLYDVQKEKIVDTYHFKDLVVLGSPSWSSDAKRVVFTAVDKSGTSDLYIWDTEKLVLTRLTNDVYDERDPEWSPTSDKIVFSSDRSPYGERGVYNLFVYDLKGHDIQYLTYGEERYYSPRYSPDGRAIVFTSDLSGAQNVWMMKLDSVGSSAKEMRKITQFTTAAFDPAWADSDLIFVAFEKFSFQIRAVENVYDAFDSSKNIRRMDFTVAGNPWKPKSVGGESEVKSLRYTG